MTSPVRADGKQVLRFQVPGSGAIVLRFPSNRVRGGTATAARDVFRTFAYITLQPADQGTQVRVMLRSHDLTATFMTAWIGLAALFNIAILAIVLTGATQPYNLVFSLVLMVFGVAFIPLGRFLVRSERSALLDFVSMVISLR
jgi:hypothetical protein